MVRRPNCAIKPIAEQALRSIQTIVPQRLIAALAFIWGNCVTRLIVLPSLLFVAACATRVTAWDTLPEWRDYERIVLEGKLLRVSDSAVQICPLSEVKLKTEDSCIDVIFSEAPEAGNVHGSTVVLEGAFRRYSRDFVGMGFLTSRIGIIEGARIRGDES